MNVPRRMCQRESNKTGSHHFPRQRGHRGTEPASASGLPANSHNGALLQPCQDDPSLCSRDEVAVVAHSNYLPFRRVLRLLTLNASEQDLSVRRLGIDHDHPFGLGKIPCEQGNF